MPDDPAVFLRHLDRELERKTRELEAVERQLRRERDFATRVIDAAQAVVAVVDASGRIVRANAYAAAVTGTPAGALVGADAVDVFFAADARIAARAMLGSALSAPAGDAGTLPLLTASGERREFGWFPSPMPDPDEHAPLLLLVGRDMTERERLFREVERLSTTDPLTGLSNRRHFDAVGQLEVLRARRHGRPLTALLLDVDDFKRVNDTHGHAAGDRVLVGLSGICTSLTRRTDLKARLGGDEFCLLLPETSVASGQLLASRVGAGLAELAFEASGAPFHVTTSVGVAGYAGEEDLASLVARADHALYAAKEAGRNGVVTAGE